MTKITPLVVAALLLVAPVSPAAEVTVDASKQYQQIEGWGTCLVAWTQRHPQFYRTPEFIQAYTQDLGMNMLRVNMWGPVSQPVEDWRQIRYQDFNIDGQPRAKLFLEIGRELRKANPDMKFVGTVFSPPAWMKINRSLHDTGPGSIGGDSYTHRRTRQIVNNRVDEKYYPHFAKWVVEYARMHQAAGVPFHAISVGNEVMFTQSFESCVWTAEDYARIVVLTGRMLKEAGMGDIKLFGPETMTGHNFPHGNPMYIKAIMESDAKDYLDAFATHGYTDGFNPDFSASAPAQFWRLIESHNKPMWLTEGGTGSHDWPKALDDIGSMFHNALAIGNASAIMPWQVVGDRTTHTLMVFDGPTKKTRIAQQFFRGIPIGAVRIDARASDDAIKASAYIHRGSGTATVILINPTQEDRQTTVRFEQAPGIRSFEVRRTSEEDDFRKLDDLPVQNNQVAVPLPARSIVTLVGRSATARR